MSSISTIGTRIKTLREYKQFTAAYMAAELELSISQYWRIESDKSPVNSTRLALIAKLLGVNVDTLCPPPAKTSRIPGKRKTKSAKD